MEQITIQVKNKRKAQALVDFLKAMDLIEDITASGLPTPNIKDKTDEDDFFALKGLWAGRDVTLDSIRQKVWPACS